MSRTTVYVTSAIVATIAAATILVQSWIDDAPLRNALGLAQRRRSCAVTYQGARTASDSLRVVLAMLRTYDTRGNVPACIRILWNER